MGRVCINDHRPEHSLGGDGWLNGCAQCEIERLRSALRCAHAAIRQCQPCADQECAAVQQDYLETAAAVAAERERCAKLCEGLREAAEHGNDGLKRAGAMAMAASCARLIRA
jgi:hypothetical protein